MLMVIDMVSNKSFITSFILLITLLASCDKEEITTFQSNPVLETKRLNLIFLDKADPTANIAIYLNSTLLKASTSGGTKGLQQITLPDSLTDRALMITLAEHELTHPPARLQVQNLIYEMFILPEELATLNTVVFSRENAASRITVFKSGLQPTESAPEPGYFKIRFLNLTSSKLDVFNRSGVLYQNLANINAVEERAFQQLPFGTYRFNVRRQSDGSTLGTIPSVAGEAGKIYNILCTDDGQVVTELGDYGVPKTSFAYVAYMNFLPRQPQVRALPLPGSTRKEAAQKQYAKFDGVELVPTGTQTFSVEVGQEKLTASYELMSNNYLMVMVVDNFGKPELQFVSVPMDEPNTVNARFLNFASDTARVSFGRISTDVVLAGLEEPPASVLNLTYASNLKFGEIRTSKSKIYPNSVYTNLGNGSLIIQAYQATAVPSKLGESIAHARTDFPFTAVPYSNYTVVLSGIKGELNPELRPRITVISHSF